VHVGGRGAGGSSSCQAITTCCSRAMHDASHHDFC
jgi:hypothetical protein